jgi:uncharacterized membrane protein
MTSAWLHSLLLLVWLIIGIGLRLTNLTAKPPWTDEFSTLVFSLGNSFLPIPLDQVISVDVLLQPLQPQPNTQIKDVWTHLLNESNHPPLYFVLSHWWMQLFPTQEGIVSLWGGRSLAAIFGAASIPAIYGLSWLAFRSLTVSHLAAALMATSPYGIFLAQEARHYTLALLWVIATLAHLVIACRHIQNRTQLPLWLTLSWIGINALGIATHYFFTLTLCIEAFVLIALGWRGRRRDEGVEEQRSRGNKGDKGDKGSQCGLGVSRPSPQVGKPAHRGGSTDSSLKSGNPPMRLSSPSGATGVDKGDRGIYLVFPTSPPWFRIYAITVGTTVAGLVWIPVFLHNTYGGELTDWIQGSRVGIAWISPIFQALAAWITMISLLPVEAPQLGVVLASGLVMLIFFIWVTPIVVFGLKVRINQPQTRLATQVFGSFVACAIALFFFFTYFLNIDLTRGARYNFVYFPAVIVLLGASLAVCWQTPKGEKVRWGVTGKKAVMIVLVMGYLSAITVVYNLGYQKYYRADLFVKLIHRTSHVPVLISTTQRTHVQIGEMMGVAREFKIEHFHSSSPLFLLAHQDKNPITSTIALQKTLKTLPRPFDLWLVNFYASKPEELKNCVADTQPMPAINGYEYKLYHCKRVRNGA